MEWTWVVTAAAALASISASAAAQPQAGHTAAQQAVEELLAADRAFSAAGASGPMIDSLAAMFDLGVIMPLPGARFAPGRDAAVAALKANGANLNVRAEWSPVRGGVSADGLDGFTYGFMTIREDGKPDRRAKYLAYWVKHPEGWRVAAYKRGGSPEGPVQTALRPPALPTQMSDPIDSPAIADEHRDSLVAAEKAFSDRAQKIGLGPAFVEFGAPDAINLGPGADFTFGNAAIGAGIGGADTGPSQLYWAADHDARVASSGDLGVTFGFINRHQPPADAANPAFAFFTIWRRAGPGEPWRYVAE